MFTMGDDKQFPLYFDMKTTTELMQFATAEPREETDTIYTCYVSTCHRPWVTMFVSVTEDVLLQQNFSTISIEARPINQAFHQLHTPPFPAFTHSPTITGDGAGI